MRVTFLLALLLAAPTVWAQATTPEAAVAALFDAMRARDSTAARAALHPQVRLLTTVTQRDGTPAVMESGVTPFLVALADSPVAWDEQIEGLVVQRDGALASAWMDYRFYAGERFSHCGVNAMHLAETAAGWQILHIVDTRRTDCGDGG